jgi:hypothetical protein
MPVEITDQVRIQFTRKTAPGVFVLGGFDVYVDPATGKVTAVLGRQ